MHPTSVRSDPVRAVSVRLLRCPACGESAPQKLVRPDQVNLQAVPGRPFARAIAWADGADAPADSPLWHGLCLCPECRHPALPCDHERRAANSEETAMLRRHFVDESAGATGPLGALLGPAPELAAPPVRALRVNLAAIAALRLWPSSPARLRSLARLQSRLAWLYLDAWHLVWQPGPRTTLAAWTDRGRGPDGFAESLESLELLRPIWPEIPLTEIAARDQAVAAQEALCRVTAAEAADHVHPEELRRLALLRGLNGESGPAEIAYREAIELCRTGCEGAYEAYRRGREVGAEPDELRRLGDRARRFEEQLTEYEREAALSLAIAPRPRKGLRLPAWIAPEPEDAPRLLGLFG